MQKLTELQKARNTHLHYGRLLNIPLSVTDRQADKNITKETEVINNKMNKLI